MSLSFEKLRDEYSKMFEACVVNTSRVEAVRSVIRRMSLTRSRYAAVAAKFGEMPWWFVGLIHNMECGGDFKRHLHNGDPLTGRTRQVPAGRPKEPPIGGGVVYPWEQSAEDALRLKKLDQWGDWSIPAVLFLLEKFNGFGYRLYHSHVKSPYLWSFTNHYIRGKYVADGRWSDYAVSEQVGCAAVLKTLEKDGFLNK